uniref:ATP synthase F0 subunit 8 n=1 Tax=Mileewa lamellata TaxID=2984022 RepID=A0A977TM97_9HEMI|nr:ATP synthase F0 subunit 8 [Mileewa lamellata]UXX17543.1 ATP synthase F0 subunit 8 [Mileewa lamellata]
MPQMSPMWWMSLMLMTIFMMFLLNSMLYFNMNKIKMQMKKFITPKNNWKW